MLPQAREPIHTLPKPPPDVWEGTVPPETLEEQRVVGGLSGCCRPRLRSVVSRLAPLPDSATAAPGADAIASANAGVLFAGAPPATADAASVPVRDAPVDASRVCSARAAPLRHAPGARPTDRSRGRLWNGGVPPCAFWPRQPTHNPQPKSAVPGAAPGTGGNAGTQMRGQSPGASNPPVAAQPHHATGVKSCNAARVWVGSTSWPSSAVEPPHGPRGPPQGAIHRGLTAARTRVRSFVAREARSLTFAATKTEWSGLRGRRSAGAG